MDAASTQIVLVLEYLVKPIQVGTNLALFQLMWVMLNGSFLQSRGAVHSALAKNGLDRQAISRSWRALRSGVWSTEELLLRWNRWVLGETAWRSMVYGEWQPVAIDTTTFWRPKLQNWTLRGFHQVAGKLLPGVVVGVVVNVGEVGGQRVPLLRRLLRAPKDATDETSLKARLLRYAAEQLSSQEVAVLDGGFKLSTIQAAEVPAWVVRMQTNCVLRRNRLPKRKNGRGRKPEYGLRVRPLARTYNGNLIPASTPDVILTFDHNAISVTARGWNGLVRSELKVDPGHPMVTIWVFDDPRYRTPLVVATNLTATAEQVFRLYLDRWPVEQVPLVAKQMLGLHRMFVRIPVAVWRLTELALLMGNVLTIVAAVLPPMPTGFWDRHPKKRVVVCAGRYNGLIFHRLRCQTGKFAKRHPRPLIFRTANRQFKLTGRRDNRKLSGLRPTSLLF